MAIVVGYTPATEKLLVTGGTSGTPATWAHVHDADMAGTLTLLDAAVIASDPDTFSLDTAVRPAEDKALLLTISASADRVGATCTITGTSVTGAALVEAGIDISGAFSAPVVTTAAFASVAAVGVSCAGMTNGDTVSITQGRWGVIREHILNGSYQLAANADFGDGFTSSYFRMLKESVR